MQRIATIPGITFTIVFVWKIALLVFTAQPVPANDSFFYDGAVVNLIEHGRYVNPSLAFVLPVSANEVFSAYPPLYQFALLGWMKCFGTGALAQMWFHVLLFGAFELALLGVLRRLNTPATAMNLAGLFLFGITFHDRPDSLAHVLGMASLYATLRATTRWCWLAAAFNVLTLCTSLQIGGFYLALVTLLHCLRKRNGEPLPRLPLAMAWLIPVLLVCAVKLGAPLWWAGFREHAQLTPTFTNLRVPAAADLLKVIRTVPALLVVALVARWINRGQTALTPHRMMQHAVMWMSLTTVAGALTVLTPNLVAIAGYAQPLLVGCALAMIAANNKTTTLPRSVNIVVLACALLVSVRALGMTTWGAVCARDTDYAAALKTVNATLDSVPPGQSVIVSSTFLYETAKRKELKWIHSDWPSPPNRTNPDWVCDALIDLKPAALVLTQFDFYRRYQGVLATLTNRAPEIGLRVRNFAHTPTPDSIPAMQKVVQHISWSPVIVEIDWPRETGTK